MICGKESNLEISLCKSCYDIQLAINKKSIIGLSNLIRIYDLTIKKILSNIIEWKKLRLLLKILKQTNKATTKTKTKAERKCERKYWPK